MSFQKRVIISICCFLIMLIGILSGFIYIKTSKILNVDAKTLMYSKLDQIADNVKSTIELNKEKVKVISRDNHLEEFFKENVSLEIIENYLIEIRADENIYGEFYKDILLIDLEGVIIAATSSDARNIDVSDREYFKIANLTGGTVLSDGFAAKTDKESATMVLAPIIDEDNGSTLGYVAIALFSEKFTDYIQKIELGETGYYIIVDSNNRILSHKYKDEYLKDFKYNLNEPTFSVETKDGIMFAAHTSIDIEGNKWKAIALLTEKEIYHNSNQLLMYILFIGLIFVIISIFAGTYLSNLLIRPITRLTQIIKMSSAGDKKYNEALIEELDMVAGSILGMRTKNIIEVNDLREAIYSMKKYIKKGILKTSDEKSNSIERCTLILSHQIHVPLVIIKKELDELSSSAVHPEHMDGIKRLNEAYKIIEKELLISIEDIQAIDFKQLVVKDEITLEHLMKSILEFSKDFVNKNNRIFSFVNDIEEPNLEIVKADMVMLKRAWMSFLYNAVFYTEEAGEITLKFSIANNCIRIELIDYGTGMELEDLDALYENLYDFENSSDKSIFGVLISKKILEAHDFPIGFRSVEEQYTRVWFDVEI